MHERRNFILILVLGASFIWAFVAWLMLGVDAALLWPQRIASTALVLISAAWLAYGMWIEDRLPDHLREVVGDMYYESDGVSFMPIVRTTGDQAELSVYYQNRYENPAQVIIHLRPPEDSFIIRPGMRDVHFAFRASGGDFGVIHQPIAVPEHLQGDVLDIQLAAATLYPRSQGARWRRRAGMPCGTLPVDWGGAAFRIGVHEVSGEIELFQPRTLHLSMPKNVSAEQPRADLWKQEQLAAGAEA